MRQNQLDGLVAFVCVARLANFSSAAQRLGVSPSAVSQSIRALEHRLGVMLFHRTTRSVHLTDAGARFLARVQPAVDELISASTDVGDDGGPPSGLLRLIMPRAGYLLALRPLLRDFLETYPEMKMEIAIDNTMIDLSSHGFDAGIRFGGFVEKDVTSVSIGPSMMWSVVASPEYIAKRGIARHPRDLLTHECIKFRRTSGEIIQRWNFTNKNENLMINIDGRLILGDLAVMVQAALDGLGVIYTVNGYVERFIEEGRLVRMLEDWSPPTSGLVLYYPARPRISRKLKVLIDYLHTHSKFPLDETSSHDFMLDPLS
ncbi:LysR family transcriptional regulator [Zymomonas mobilis]|uniref:Transcriptional regulator, LysR family n=1 Tax=Zymomonas mobilis subsp. pomaceae (strain ATCC 29192 / DSM 22645 / JCM 10191 / CCUG 17912 / NBRC 13757 / NCIMB 11200 / NRRL B-4491 / Barker I) TaxID=579138 RepID=F8EVG5_ZYMMT|nr:LysR family transcriptional regulator [Zymomonas mobilis]AEI37372.1 transcriptional regulator, LysR family [Zymomonas mobilis subsp. pomaceae ATCC 29192]MDX5948740.1 LysR family transcriptional regulator [Zymomonas mobilis subsp. pomaceae]GEB88545.1 LysR family transcriptional regulator [Zymomonas mobilis subsp. pomaceae]